MSKLPAPTQSSQRVRPYWHVDAKWIFGILLSVILALWLLLVVAYNVTSREVAVPTIKGVLQAFINSIPVGEASQEAIDDFRQQIAESPTKSLQLIPGAPAITEADLNLSPEQLRDKIFNPILDIAEPLYDKGARALAQEQTDDKVAQDKLVNDLSAVGILSKQSHEAIGQWVIIGLFAVLAVGVPAALFSYRFGRIVTPASVMLIVGLPGLIAFSALAAPGPSEQTAAADAQNYLELTMANKGALTPMFAAGQQVYAMVVLIALGLLVGTILGKVAYVIIKRAKNSPGPA